MQAILLYSTHHCEAIFSLSWLPDFLERSRFLYGLLDLHVAKGTKSCLLVSFSTLKQKQFHRNYSCPVFQEKRILLVIRQKEVLKYKVVLCLRFIYTAWKRKSAFFFDLCRWSRRTLNWILYEPIWKRCRCRFCFHSNLNELYLCQNFQVVKLKWIQLSRLKHNQSRINFSQGN